MSPIKVVEPVIWPSLLSTKPLALIWVSFTLKPPIEADTNLAKPCESILALELASVDGAPSIVAGVLMLSTTTSPRTVRLLPLNSTYWADDLSPIKTAEAVKSPVSFTLKTPLPLVFRADAPAKNLVSPIDDIPTNLPLEALLIASRPMFQLAIKPVEAVNWPSITAPLAINIPLEETAKLFPNLM